VKTREQSSHRIEFLDVLRGVALFGILVVNVFSFGADIPAWSSGADQIAWHLKHFFFETKFWALFSLLFGMGFYLQIQAAGYRVVRLLRRMAALMLFGCLHALFFEGDILMLYAELGIILLLIYRFSNRALILLAVLLCLSFPAGHLWGGDRDDDWPVEDPTAALDWLAEQRLESPLVEADISGVVKYHAQFIPERFWVDWQYPDSGFLVLAYFIFGFVFMRSGWHRLQSLSTTLLLRSVALLWVFGTALMLLERYFNAALGYSVFDRSQESNSVIALGDVTYLIATGALTSAWFLTVWLWVKVDVWPALRRRCANLGTISLSVYLSQTAIMMGVFHGYGLGAAFQWGPARVVVLACVVFLCQIFAAEWWCRRFSLGPIEWVWRCLTDWRWYPFATSRRKYTGG
jgi:uncharacterized protein